MPNGWKNGHNENILYIRTSPKALVLLSIGPVERPSKDQNSADERNKITRKPSLGYAKVRGQFIGSDQSEFLPSALPLSTA